MENIVDLHWFPLVSQGNIYSLTNLRSTKNANKVLVASLKRNIYLCECHVLPKNQINPLIKELLFTYIPSGAEIISIDAYNKSKEDDEFVIGITIMKYSSETSVERYLNIYSEGAGDTDDNNSIEAIAQNCLMVELNYTPYHLYHTEVITQDLEKEIVWLISSDDFKVHMIREDKTSHGYIESEIDKYFPEFIELKAIALWMDIYYYEDYKRRLTVVGCECGLVKVSEIDVIKGEINRSWSLRYDSPVSGVRIFTHRNLIEKPSFLEMIPDVEMNINFNILINTASTTIIFEDVLNQGLDNDIKLRSSDPTSCVLCCCIADINMDNQNEILLGTYEREVLVFANRNGKWEMTSKKLFDAAIHSICYTDLTGDGVNELVVLTQRSVHILQHDSKIITELWRERYQALIADKLKD
ncbi:KICSTOR complex protein kaptin-like isoform X1 [Leptopilina heterotoma]|uniref:KICSTOR complex protein kaptin-like isoform X1 n=1 Tax=Leptopilina heterotoma TaxID=63436 RepID=UPI001CA8F649|nr:KICSTOR complex protein kaptin-like isoform X1 [Leptopilina heterotoma]